MLEMWLSGFQGLLHVDVFLFVVLGMAIGLVFGAIPGLGGSTAIALLIPLTYSMEPFTALALAGGVMGSVPMGGSITSILLNTPGTAPNAATCLDGHPLAQQGKAGLAIGAAGSANAIGAIIGTISVLIVLPIANDIVLLFGPPEFFLMSVFALIVVATATRGKMLRGLVTGAFGLMIAYIGYNDIAGGERFTYGIEYLWDGIHLVPALIGLFAVAEMINLTVKGGTVAKSATAVKITSMTSGLFETFRHLGTVLRGSLIGTTVGAIPGLGGTVVAFLSYSVTVQASKNPESFGKGNIQGVIAPEAAIWDSGGRGDGGVLRTADHPRHAAGAPDAARPSGGDLRSDLGVDGVLRVCVLRGPRFRSGAGEDHAHRFLDSRAAGVEHRLCRFLCDRHEHRKRRRYRRLRPLGLFDDALRLPAADDHRRPRFGRQHRTQSAPIDADG